ncbi:hypothetical protein JKP88DRAFT_315222, partial [Tribonema minus]
MMPESQGVMCAAAAAGNQHFTCDVCLDRWVASLADDPLKLAGSGGFVRCTGVNCASKAFDPHTVAQHIRQETHTKYRTAVEAGIKQLNSFELQAAFNKRLEDLRLELMNSHSTNALDQAARQGELHVVERVLTLHCPTCDKAFLDFEDCFAIRCRPVELPGHVRGKIGCGNSFCGWCMQPCGQDAHNHVRSCKFKMTPPDNLYYGSFELFNQTQKNRRQRMLGEYLSTINEELRAAIEVRIMPHLRDLGMELPAWA